MSISLLFSEQYNRTNFELSSIAHSVTAEDLEELYFLVTIFCLHKADCNLTFQLLNQAFDLPWILLFYD